MDDSPQVQAERGIEMTPKRNSRYYGLLARNMIAVIVVVSLTPLLLTGLIIQSHFSDAYRQKVHEHLSELVQKHSQNIDRFLQDRLGNIRILVRSTPLADFQRQEFLNERLRLLREEFGGVFVDLGLVDMKGIQVAYAGPFNLMRADYSDSYWFKQAVNSEHYISDVFTGLRGTPHFIVAVRHSWDGGEYILRSTIDFDAFNKLVENVSLGQTGFAYILNRQGEFQTKPRTEVSLTRSPYLDFQYGPYDDKALGVAEAKAEDGEDWVLAMAPIKRGEWVLCIQQQASDAYSVVADTRRTVLFLFTIGAMVIIVVAWIMARRIVNRIKESDQAKTAMNEKVIEAGRLASIGELAAGIAHEINNPVAIMVEEAGWIDDLLSDEECGESSTIEELQRAVIQIRTQGQRCKEITHKLLSFARKTDPRTDHVSLNQIVEDTISLIKQKTRYANVKVVSELDEALPFVAAPPSELQQVMLNLVNNAVDAIGSEGGTVTLVTRPENGKVIVEVTDTGSGIPEPLLTKIFDPFFTTKPVGQGTGLGLSICFGIVNKLGGEIKVKSQVGLGTFFIIMLPAVGPTDSGADQNTAGQTQAPGTTSGLDSQEAIR
jgi:two-component system NtrC family sensor kinase